MALFNKKDFAEYNFETSDALVVADYLINDYNEKVHNTFDKVGIDEKEFYITPLKLQKLLYYIQGLSSVIYEKPAFDNKIVCWSYGPVINDVYNMYKGRKDERIKENNKKYTLDYMSFLLKSFNDFLLYPE